MEISNQRSYPNIAQSWGIVGIAIVAQIIFTPVFLALTGVLNQEVAMLVLYVLSMGAAFAFAHYIRKKETTLSHYPIRKASLKVFILVVLLTIAVGVGFADPLANLIPMPDFFKQMFETMVGNKGVFSFITIVIAAPIFEELIFRGVILDGLLKKYSPKKAILYSAFLFGFIHLNPWQFIAGMLLGMLAGWVYYKTNNLLLCILIHFVNNCISFVMSIFVVGDDQIAQGFAASYGGPLPAVLIISGGVIATGVCFYLLKQELGSGVQVNQE
jgi:membrane protease YdiL (CAAX protease family)